MYDKHLLKAEIDLIKSHIHKRAKVLDAGCGEGEGSFIYSMIPGVMIHAVDFSETRLKKAKLKLKSRKNIMLKKVDFLHDYKLDKNYDLIISQRFLINIMSWKFQRKVLLDFMSMLRKGGKLIMLEGSRQGVDSLNEFRLACGLKSIPIKWHNLFFDDDMLINFMKSGGFKLIKEEGLGAYFLLTRGIRPMLDRDLGWNCRFNKIAATQKICRLIRPETQFSRLKLWVFQK
jgi:ubiquinone/menaquinone biosynthesis C-methylase UbiE